MPCMQWNSNSTLHHLFCQCTSRRFGYLLLRFEAGPLNSGDNTLSSPWLIASSLIGLQPLANTENSASYSGFLPSVLVLAACLPSKNIGTTNYGPTAILSSTTAAASALICSLPSSLDPVQ